MKRLLFFSTPEGNLGFSILFAWLYSLFIPFLLGGLGLLSFSEIETQTEAITIIYLSLFSIGILYFFYVFIVTFSKVKRYRVLFLPLITFSFPFWMILGLLGISAAYLWFGIVLIPLLIIAVPIAAVIGFIWDLRTARTSKK